jgi:hypothetical protein
MEFRDLHEIGAMFRELGSGGVLEQACFDAYQRKLAYKREWYRFNRERVCAHQRAYYRANKATINEKDRARKNTDRVREMRRDEHKPGPQKPSQRAWYERKKLAGHREAA